MQPKTSSTAEEPIGNIGFNRDSPARRRLVHLPDAKVTVQNPDTSLVATSDWILVPLSATTFKRRTDRQKSAKRINLSSIRGASPRCVYITEG